MKPTDIEDLYELSPLQLGILFHSLAAPEPGVYLITMSYALRGRLDRPAFERAWQRTMNRNPILRTSFHWEDINKPLQVVHREARVRLEELDWRSVPEEEQTERLAAFLERERTQGFPLDRAPLMRITLVHTGDERHRLIWTFHHILLEGWSASLVLREVFTHYRGLRLGEEVELEPRRPYRDYILWLQQRDLSSAEAYWRRTLQGFSSPTPLPAARPSAPWGGKEVYGSQRLSLPTSTSAALAALARRNQLTLSTLLHGAWALLLSRYSGEEDVLFGSVVSGRQGGLPEAESMVGLFVNTLPARVPVPPEATVLAWLKELQDRHVEMREFEYSPLLQVQSWSGVPPGTKLFESIFAFENWAGDVSLRGLAEELEAEEARCIEGGTDYPLTVEFGGGSRVSGVFTYDRRRFLDTAVARLISHYETLLQKIVAHPRHRLSELSLLTSEERQQALVDWNRTRRDYPREAGIHELFDVQAARRPEAIAVSFGGEELSYGELSARGNRLAHHLRRCGVGREVRVGICMERSVEMVVGLLGILKAGGAYVPLDPSYPKERLAFMLEDSRVPVLLTQERLLGALPESGTRVVCLDRDWGAIAAESDANPGSGAGGQNLAYVIFTSGSTGRPKGVEVAHGGLVNLALWHCRLYGMGTGDRATQVASPAFDAMAWEVWPCLASGASLHVPDEETRSSPSRLVSWLAEERITHSFLPTPLAEAVLKERGATRLGLRYLLTGGDTLHRVETTGLPFRLVNHYGPTESTVVATCVEVASGREVNPPIGRPIANTRVYVLDRHANVVPVGVPGELFIGGDGLARGYLNRPELTAERFVPDPFSEEGGGRLYRTGDLAMYLPEGEVEFLGRLDHQVKVRGYRIELGEIESALRSHPMVRDSVLVVREDATGDKRLVAYVVPAEGGTLEVAVLRNFLKKTLPDHMLPAAFLALESLPITPNGKLDRTALPPPEGRPSLQEAFVPPGNEEEKTIAAVWQEALQLESVGVHDNFFDLGGHSLLLLRVQSRLRDLLKREDLSVVDLFRYPTIRALAEYVRPRDKPGRAPEDVEAEAQRREAGRERLGRRREIRTALAGMGDADA